MWTNWKNNQGSKRSDGVYLRASWGWYIHTPENGYLSLKGWDLLKGLTTLGTIAKYPLEEAKAKIDKILPIGVKARSHYPDGMFLPNGPWMYSIYECQSCKEDSYLEGTNWGLDLIECPFCKGTTYHPAAWTVRELEPQPHWVFANRSEKGVYEYLADLKKRTEKRQSEDD